MWTLAPCRHASILISCRMANRKTCGSLAENATSTTNKRTNCAVRRKRRDLLVSACDGELVEAAGVLKAGRHPSLAAGKRKGSQNGRRKSLGQNPMGRSFRAYYGNVEP